MYPVRLIATVLHSVLYLVGHFLESIPTLLSHGLEKDEILRQTE